MIPLQLTEAELSAATPFLGVRLERWQGALRESAERCGVKTYAPEVTGPIVTRRSLYVSAAALEHAYAALLDVRARIFQTSNERDGVVAVRSLEPVVHAIEVALDARSSHRRAGRRSL